MHTQCYFYVLFSDLQWYVFNIFATYTLGKRDVNNPEKRKDSKLHLFIGTPFGVFYIILKCEISPHR